MILESMVKKVSTLGQRSIFLQGYSLANERYDLDSLKVHRQTIQGIYNDCVKMCGEKMLFEKVYHLTKSCCLILKTANTFQL